MEDTEHEAADVTRLMAAGITQTTAERFAEERHSSGRMPITRLSAAWIEWWRVYTDAAWIANRQGISDSKDVTDAANLDYLFAPFVRETRDAIMAHYNAEKYDFLFNIIEGWIECRIGRDTHTDVFENVVRAIPIDTWVHMRVTRSPRGGRRYEVKKDPATDG